MVIDMHTHYVPEVIAKKASGGRGVSSEGGVPTQTMHDKLFRLDLRIQAMDEAGVDVAVLSAPAATKLSLDDYRLLNDKMKEAEQSYSGRIYSLASVPALGGPEALAELRRCARELGFRGVCIESSVQGTPLDSRDLYPFYETVRELGLFIFIHPALRALGSEFMAEYDIARMVGREFGLVLATIRLIVGGVFDDFPGLRVNMSHLGGGITLMLERVRGMMNRSFWGTENDPVQGKVPKRPFDEYMREMYFDTGGFSGSMKAVQAALIELSPQQVTFGTDYPQEIRTGEKKGRFVWDLREMGLPAHDCEDVLWRNASRLLGI